MPTPCRLRAGPTSAAPAVRPPAWLYPGPRVCVSFPSFLTGFIIFSQLGRDEVSFKPPASDLRPGSRIPEPVSSFAGGGPLLRSHSDGMWVLLVPPGAPNTTAGTAPLMPEAPPPGCPEQAGPPQTPASPSRCLSVPPTQKLRRRMSGGSARTIREGQAHWRPGRNTKQRGPCRPPHPGPPGSVAAKSQVE